MTICQLLTLLYKRSVIDQREEDAGMLESCYIMAKKMNKRLSEYAGLEISPKEVEEVWLNELRVTAERNK